MASMASIASMAAARPTGIVVLNRPAAGSYAYVHRGDEDKDGEHDNGDDRLFEDCDEGDILDELRGVPLSLPSPPPETPRQKQRQRPIQLSDDDDGTDTTSVCSGTTVTEDDSHSYVSDGSESNATSVTSATSISSRSRSSRRSGARQRQRQGHYHRGSISLSSVADATEKDRKPITAEAVAAAVASAATAAAAKKSHKKQHRTDSTSTARTSSRKARTAVGPCLKIGLDVAVDLELKAKVQGDICLTLLVEEESKMTRRPSPEVRRNGQGSYVVPRVEELEAEDEEEAAEWVQHHKLVQPRRELCHIRVTRLRLSRRWWMAGYEWLNQLQPAAVAGVLTALPAAGFAIGWAASRW